MTTTADRLANIIRLSPDLANEELCTLLNANLDQIKCALIQGTLPGTVFLAFKDSMLHIASEPEPQLYNLPIPSTGGETEDDFDNLMNLALCFYEIEPQYPKDALNDFKIPVQTALANCLNYLKGHNAAH